MEDDEFNFHRIVKCEKNVAQQALMELFEGLWDKQFPETPWKKDSNSVQLFEEEEEKHFQKSLEGLSNREKGRKSDKRNRLLSTFRDREWKNYKWDTSKFAYALVDSKLFKLDQTDELGMPVSEHIAKIKDMRNKTAHFTAVSCDNANFQETLKTIGDHIKAFELAQLNVSPYLEELQRIRSQEKPVSGEKWWEMRTQFEKLKSQQQIYEEREKRYTIVEKLNEEKEQLSGELKWLKTEIELQKQAHSKEIQRFQSEHESLKQKHLQELEKLKNENESERLICENYLQKQSYFAQHKSLQFVNELLPRMQTYEGLKRFEIRKIRIFKERCQKNKIYRSKLMKALRE